MDTNKECVYCRYYLYQDNIYNKFLGANILGKYCSLYCYNISNIILDNTNHNDIGRLCSYCSYILLNLRVVLYLVSGQENIIVYVITVSFLLRINIITLIFYKFVYILKIEYKVKEFYDLDSLASGSELKI